MRIVIVGIGETGHELARILVQRPQTELVLIDIDDDLCQKLSGELDALVISGDGSDPQILKKGQIDIASALVATTGSDAINTVIAMLGKQLDVQKVIVKLKGFGLRSACREIGVTRIISPQMSAAAEIISVLHGFDKVNFSLLSAGGLRLADIKVSEGEKKRISELDLPDGTLIVGIMRESRLYFPRPDFKLQSQDFLLVLLEQDQLLKKTQEIIHNG
ncbi:MAG: NAD-binding protein [Desulfobacterales bacterium]